jgi:hypothetical protein
MIIAVKVTNEAGPDGVLLVLHVMPTQRRRMAHMLDRGPRRDDPVADR